MAKTVKLDIEAILKTLGRTGFATIKSANLIGYGSHNDLANLMDLFLAHGYRPLTASDLKIDTEVMELMYWEKLPFEITFGLKPSNRRKDADEIQISRLKIATITTAAQVKKKRTELMRKFAKMPGGVRSTGFNIFAEDTFYLKPIKPKRDNTGYSGSLSKSMLLHGTGHFPWKHNVDVPRNNLASICLIKVS